MSNEISVSVAIATPIIMGTRDKYIYKKSKFSIHGFFDNLVSLTASDCFSPRISLDKATVNNGMEAFTVKII